MAIHPPIKEFELNEVLKNCNPLPLHLFVVGNLYVGRKGTLAALVGAESQMTDENTEQLQSKPFLTFSFRDYFR